MTAVCRARHSASKHAPQTYCEGLRYVRQHVWLWGTFLCATFTYLLFIGPTQVLLPYVVRNTLHQGASTYGAVLAAGGVGAHRGGRLHGPAALPEAAHALDLRLVGTWPLWP